MHADDLRHLAIQLAALSQQIERQAGESAALMAHTAQEFDAAAHRASGQVTEILQRETRAVLSSTVDDTSERLQVASRDMLRAAQSLRHEAGRLLQRRRAWSAFAAAAMIAGALLAAGGSGWVVHHNRQALAAIEHQGELQRLVDSGVLVRCGEALCVRLGESPQPRADGYFELR